MKSTHTEVDLLLTVTEKSYAADGVSVLTLTNTADTELPSWTPGAHIDLVLTSECTRQYSLCGDPDDRKAWKIGVLYEAEGRGGSRFIHDNLSVGDTVNARGPRNHFEIQPSSNYLFIAGGIGITPIMAMADHVAKLGAAWTMVYGGRSRSSMAFADDLAERFPANVTLHPQDERGLPDLDGLLGSTRADTLIYACGPTALLDAVADRCHHFGWPSTALHLERFSPKVLDEPSSAESFEVELSLSGITVTVGPDESILDVVTANGIDVLSSCAEGTCGTCETTVIDGEVDHRDSILSEDEQAANESMMICVSRANCPKLVLEL